MQFVRSCLRRKQISFRWFLLLTKTIRNTSKTQKPARWDHQTAPSNARSVAIAADRTEGDIMIEGVGEDSGSRKGGLLG